MLVQKETSYPCLPFFPFADWNVRCDGSTTSNHADEANSYGNDGVWNKKTNPEMQFKEKQMNQVKCQFNNITVLKWERKHKLNYFWTYNALRLKVKNL